MSPLFTIETVCICDLGEGEDSRRWSEWGVCAAIQIMCLSLDNWRTSQSVKLHRTLGFTVAKFLYSSFMLNLCSG